MKLYSFVLVLAIGTRQGGDDSYCTEATVSVSRGSCGTVTLRESVILMFFDYKSSIISGFVKLQKWLLPEEPSTCGK